jgi:hypothetical protein
LYLTKITTAWIKYIVLFQNTNEMSYCKCATYETLHNKELNRQWIAQAMAWMTRI